MLVLAIAAAIILVRELPQAKSRPVAWHDLSGRVGVLTITHFERRLFRHRDNLEQYFAEADARRPPPKVDFGSRELLLLSPGPRSSTGYSIKVLSVTERGGKITVKVKERTPTLADKVKPRVTYPYRLLSLPARKDVYVDWIGR